MKKVLGIIGLFVMLIVLNSACTFYSKTAIAKYEQATSKEVLGVGVAQIPTVVTLDVNPERLSEEIEYVVIVNIGKDKEHQKMYKAYSKIYGKETAQRMVTEYRAAFASQYFDAAKAYAKSKLLIKYGADVLIDPRYSIESIDNERVKVLVSGYLGTYKNFRPMVEKDTALLKVKPVIYQGESVSGGIKVE